MQVIFDHYSPFDSWTIIHEIMFLAEKLWNYLFTTTEERSSDLKKGLIELKYKKYWNSSER